VGAESLTPSCDFFFGLFCLTLQHTASPLPSVQEAACSRNSLFWTYVLAEVGRACAGKDFNLQLVRDLVSKRLANLVAPTNAKADDATPLSMVVLRSNYHSLFFSISGSRSAEVCDSRMTVATVRTCMRG
jgi:hypothetical protein